MIDRIACDPGRARRAARARTRGRARASGSSPARPSGSTIDLDATLLTAHSDKEGAAGQLQGRLRLSPDARLLRRDRRGAGRRCCAPATPARTPPPTRSRSPSAALEQIPREHIETIEILLRVDSAGASHELLDWAATGDIRFSVGYDLTETVRAAILADPRRRHWVCAVDQDGSERANGQVAELTDLLDLAGWPDGVAGDRPPRAPAPRRAAVVHRPRRAPLPSDPHRPDRPRHRRASSAATAPAPASRTTSATTRTPALRTCRSATSSTTTSGSKLVLIAHDLIAWTQTPAADRRARHRRAQAAALPAAAHRRPPRVHARTATLRLQATWPWADALAAAFARLAALPAPRADQPHTPDDDLAPPAAGPLRDALSDPAQAPTFPPERLDTSRGPPPAPPLTQDRGAHPRRHSQPAYCTIRAS